MEMLIKQTDEQLVAAYANGNNEAFDALLNRHQTQVFSYIMRIVRNRDLANDIFQETFVKAITTIRQGRYTDAGKFGAWVNRIAHNLVIDFYRQEKSENTTSTDEGEMDILNRADLSEGTVEDVIVNEQIRKDVRRIIRELPKTQRDVLVMRYYRNLSFKQIADMTGVSINTALGRMRYALINMRRIAKERNIALTA
ncbi:MAG: sigma-70 family RNA polymerase sigma factor [Muribaculaceae bacterium]|jgi:RNA polymerase sigma-70 factor (ECF subfamily)|nr:sigma-70 family RNA polymerase sigma factor [Muribaculaceae bacterium]